MKKNSQTAKKEEKKEALLRASFLALRQLIKTIYRRNFRCRHLSADRQDRSAFRRIRHCFA